MAPFLVDLIPLHITLYITCLTSPVIHFFSIQTMIEIISSKLKSSQCDEVMEIAWSAMWNVTDETPNNCQRFIDNNGMDLFLQCLEVGGTATWLNCHF